MFLYLAFAVLTLTYVWLRFNYGYWKRRGVIGPEPTLLFGNIFKTLTFQKNISELQVEWYNQFNNVPIVGFYKLTKPAIMIRDPEIVKDVLVKAFPNFHTNEATVTAFDENDLVGKNPFFLDGDAWKRGRSVFANLFSANKVRMVFPSMMQVGKEWADYVKSFGPKHEFDAKTICAKFTLETMLRCTFSINGGSFADNTEFLELGKAIFNPDPVTAMKMMTSFFIPSLSNIFKTRMIPVHLEQRYIQFVKTQMTSRDSGIVKTEDVLQTILSVREKYNLTDIEVVSITISFLVEAYETSSNTLILGLYELANHPEIQDKLAQEIEDSIIKNNGEINYDVIQKNEYLDKVMNEILRSKTPFFGLQKICTKAYTIPVMEGLPNPVTIEPGTSVLIPFSGFTQDPELFPNPEIFDPERFSPEQKALRHKQAFIPFGDGPRMCIGMQLGYFNLKLGLFQMIRNFNVRFGPSQKPFRIHPMSFFNIPKDGIQLYFEPRKTD